MAVLGWVIASLGRVGAGDIDELEQQHSKDKCQNMCTDRYMDIAGLQSKSERVCTLTRHTGEFAYNR